MDADDNLFLSECGLDLLQKLLAYDPEARISAAEALQHPWFAEEPLPAPQMPSLREITAENKKSRKRSLDEEQIIQRE